MLKLLLYVTWPLCDMSIMCTLRLVGTFGIKIIYSATKFNTGVYEGIFGFGIFIFGPKLHYYLNFCCAHKVDGILVLGHHPSTK